MNFRLKNCQEIYDLALAEEKRLQQEQAVLRVQIGNAMDKTELALTQLISIKRKLNVKI